MSCGWAKASACRLQITLSCAVLCHIVSLQYLSRSSLHRLAGLPCRLFLSYGLQAVTREVHRLSLRRLICLQTINILKMIPQSDHSKSVKFCRRSRQRHWFLTIWRACPILPREASRRREASAGVRIVQTGLRKLGFCTCSSYNYHKPRISCKYR